MWRPFTSFHNFWPSDLDVWHSFQKLKPRLWLMNSIQGFHISHVYSLWQDLSRHSIIFDLATLILQLGLLFQIFNFGHNLWTRRDGAFIFHMYSLWQDLSRHSIIFDLVTLTSDLLFKNFNPGHNLWTVRDRDFIFHVYSLWQDLSNYTSDLNWHLMLPF